MCSNSGLEQLINCAQLQELELCGCNNMFVPHITKAGDQADSGTATLGTLTLMSSLDTLMASLDTLMASLDICYVYMYSV